VTDAPDEDEDEAGPAPPETSSLPSDFFDAPGEDEEGGRFFGGGVNEKQAEILDYVDAQEKEAGAAEPEKVNAAWLRKKALGFERLINKNAEMRGKFEDEPHKCVFLLMVADIGADVGEQVYGERRGIGY